MPLFIARLMQETNEANDNTKDKPQRPYAAFGPFLAYDVFRRPRLMTIGGHPGELR